MGQKSYIKCLNCGIKNIDRDYCSNCGNMINIVLSRKLEQEKKGLDTIKERKKNNNRGKIDKFLKKASKHPNSIVRLLYKIIYSVWLFLAVVIGGIISVVIGIAAG